MKKNLKVITFILIVVKNMLFISLLYSLNADKIGGVYINCWHNTAYIGFILIIFSVVFLFKDKGQAISCVVINFIYSCVLILDLWYYRANWSFLGFRHIAYSGLFNPFQRTLFNPKAIDLMFIFDLAILIYIVVFNKFNFKCQRSFKKFMCTICLGIFIVGSLHWLLDIKDITKGENKMFKMDWAPHMLARNLGPIGYHIYEATTTFNKINEKVDINDIQDIEDWFKYNKENIEGNKYKGIFRGKNLICIQLESFESFVIGKKVYNQEITPNINRLVSKSLYFNNIYEQNNGGNSIDCDMLINTSVMPLGESITFLTHPEVEYNSFPHILGREGYTTASTHAERGNDWGWGEAHHNALKFQRQWDLSTYKEDEYVGFGLSDRSFFSQFLEKVKTLPQPFYTIIPTLSSHGPFNIDKKYRKLNLPEAVDKSYIGGYFQSLNYTDEQLGIFIKNLEKEGLLNNTIIAIYGDHGGVHKYYNDKIKDVHLEGEWWKEYDRKIPFIIYGEDIEAKQFDVNGGHVDIMPTLAYLLGIPDDEYRDKVMGRILVNTNRNSTVLKGNILIGNIKDDKEREHLLKSYEIGRKIIMNNYFRNQNKIK